MRLGSIEERQAAGQKFFVYALIDPRDPIEARFVRYVGCSVDPIERLSRHLFQMRHCDELARINARKVMFLMHLALDGVEPKILFLEEVLPGRDPMVRENYWIRFFRARTDGELTNFERIVTPSEPRTPDEYLRSPRAGGRFW